MVRRNLSLADEMARIEEWLDEHVCQQGEAHSNIDRLALLAAACTNARDEVIRETKRANRAEVHANDLRSAIQGAYLLLGGALKRCAAGGD